VLSRAFAVAWSSLAATSPLTFARYLLAFFVGVVVTVAFGSSQHSEPQRLPSVAATPADVDSMRQSIDRLTAEVSRLKTAQQSVLDRVSAGAPSPPAPRNPPPRAAPPPR